MSGPSSTKCLADPGAIWPRRLRPAGVLILVGLLVSMLLFAMRYPALLALGVGVLAIAGFLLAPLSGNIALAVRQLRSKR